MSSFELAVGGRLKLKGDGEHKKKKKKKRAHSTEEPDEDAEPAAVVPADAAAPHDPVDGTGQLQTSGTTVMGRETRFTSELAIDDELVVTVVDRFRNTTADEARKVRMVLGDSSASLEAPFSCDVTSATQFWIRKAAPDPAALALAATASVAERKRTRTGEAPGELVTYEKLKDSGSAASGVWKTTVKVTERLGSRSREAVLDFRCKQKSDKFCK
jgi:hypothetical protein